MINSNTVIIKASLARCVPDPNDTVDATPAQTTKNIAVRSCLPKASIDVNIIQSGSMGSIVESETLSDATKPQSDSWAILPRPSRCSLLVLFFTTNSSVCFLCLWFIFWLFVYFLLFGKSIKQLPPRIGCSKGLICSQRIVLIVLVYT